MLISASYRTDIPHYYTPWLLNRLEAGWALVRNPLYPERVTRYALDPAVVDVLCLCSKNYAPLLPHLGSIAKRFQVHCQYTITPYGRDMEPGVPDVGTSVRTLERLSALVGEKRVVWRFDPLLVTPRYTVERLLAAFDALAPRLAPLVERCVFSYVTIYRNVSRGMPLQQAVSREERLRLAAGIGGTAARLGLRVQTCATDEDLTAFGVERGACLTLGMLERATGLAFRPLAHKGTRPGCRCMESRDIGAYDCCPNACRYCYANRDAAAARGRYRGHDPASPLLCGTPRPGDIIRQATQKSFLAAGGTTAKGRGTVPDGAEGQSREAGKSRQGILPGLEACIRKKAARDGER